MALKPERQSRIVSTYLAMCPNGAERGSIVVIDRNYLDQRPPVVTIGDGKPVGLLLNDVVNLDLTRQHLDWSKDQVQNGGKVYIMQDGIAFIKIGKHNRYPVGHPLYFDKNGKPSLIQWNERVGTLLSRPDKDGFAKAEIKIQKDYY